ncbi:NTE family protein [Lishizhenia tianjinensis]|uniref:NTE family protein n=1 Tax=Lishizhenia tianjinensis TaxID=477690 RepID=A0A1I6YS95_9FLAO|nr:patatin-like phospholipase family protein [Lishizhenia tianjinensis]SFT53283.1 NTE family protein [Lishizhenia tianjinensis]
MRHLIVFLLICCGLLSQQANAQRVGVVLSGGGATGLAHIGVLEALEEANIPIDFITGTSAGAFIGAMYASGYSPKQIKALVLSEEFQTMTRGELTPETSFLLRNDEQDASMFSFRLDTDSLLRNPLPTNFVTPALMDYRMLEILGLNSANHSQNFDSLFIPFRCVASDIANKKSVVFKTGNLNEAVRASMTYPFYINPITIDSVLYFDGGLYNNFPADVLYEEFDVDYIIGSNVSYNAAPPTEDDIVSQITNMLVTPTIFDLPCSQGILLEPQTGTNTFEFENVKQAIDAGYKETVAKLDSIREHIFRITTETELRNKRQTYFSQQTPLNIEKVVALDKNGDTLDFVIQSIKGPNSKRNLDQDLLKKRYFRAYSSPQISFLYPTLKKVSDSTHALFLYVKKEKNLKFDVGGHLSSRAVNTGYLAASFAGLRKTGINVQASTYFGKFYGSGKLKGTFDIPASYPFRFSAYYVRNRWDYFINFATFFEEVKPSFLVQNEDYYGATFSFPLGNKRTLEFDFRDFSLEDNYYQTDDFLSSDTADVTFFDGQSAALIFNTNTLNRKQWASEGYQLYVKARFVSGKERSVSGSTSPIDYDFRKKHTWLNVEVKGSYFPVRTQQFKFGFTGQGVFNTQALFANYTASILSAPSFSPLPDAKTYFFEDYRAAQYLGGGMNFIWSLNNALDLRIDPYIFQPIKKIERSNEGNFYYASWGEPKIMAAGSIIYNSPIGPVRFTTNYFPVQEKPWSVQLSFGYVLFNDRAIR